MKIKKTILISLLSIFLFIPFCSAASISDVSAAYGYKYYDTSNTLHPYQWFGTHTAANLVKYNYDLPATYLDRGVQIVDFGLRFHITNNFIAGTNYSITFTWFNENGVQTKWESAFSHLVWYSRCRVSSWTSTMHDENYCFDNFNLSYKRGTLGVDYVVVTFSFTPKVDFFGTSLYFYHDNNPYEYYFSTGWEIYDISYVSTTDGSQAIINNQNQNTQNIINNQNSNTSSIVNNQNQNTQNIINNQNSNTSSIVNNQNQNTQNIINNQNQNTQAIVDSNTACYDKTLYRSDTVETGSLWSSGQITSSNTTWGVTDYLKIKSVNIISSSPYGTVYACFYNENKVLISCIPGNTAIGKVTLPSGTVYGRFSIRDNNVPVYRVNVCSGGQQAVADTITDTNTSEANSDASNFFSGFTTETYGLTGVITAPLNVIQSITSKTCSPLVLPLPFVNQNLTLPCMGEIYTQYFGSFLTIYQTITFGIVAYWVVVRIFNLVKDFKNPDHDEIEVLDL